MYVVYRIKMKIYRLNNFLFTLTPATWYARQKFKDSGIKLYVGYIVSEPLSTPACPAHKDGRRIATAGQTCSIITHRDK